jgi:uncharacterized protein (TIGR02231 family)
MRKTYTLAAFVLIIVFTTNLFAAKNIEILSKVENVVVYHSGALVSRVADNKIGVGLFELEFKDISSKTVLNSFVIKNKEVTILNKNLIKKLSKEEFFQLEDRKTAVINQIKLLEQKYAEANFIKEVDELEKMLSFYSDKILDLNKELRKIDNAIVEAKKLDSVKLNNEDAAILKVLVSVEQQLTKSLHFEYVVGGIGWSPFYEIEVENSSSKQIELKYMAKIMSQTGENWENITLQLSSAFPLENPTKLPKPEEPWVLSYRTNQNNIKQTDNLTQNNNQQIAKLEGVDYQDIFVPSFLKLRILKGKFAIKSNSTVFSFPIMNISLPAEYSFYAYPSLDNEVYLVAKVAEWDTLGLVDGVANVTYNKNSVGKTILKFSDFSDTLLLSVGKDNSIYFKRAEIENKKYAKEVTFGKKKKITFAYEFQLKNNNQHDVVIEFFEQVPISQTKTTNVILEQLSEGVYNDEQGEVSWKINLSPSKIVKKQLIYTVEYEGGNFSFSKRKTQRFKTISSPSF